MRGARLVLRAAAVAEARAQPREQRAARRRLRAREPEERVVFDAGLPEFLGGAMVGQLEADRRLELLELAGSQLHVEIVPLVADLQNLGPREPVYTQFLSVHEQTRGAHAERDVHILRVLGGMQIDAVHRQRKRS